MYIPSVEFSSEEMLNVAVGDLEVGKFGEQQILTQKLKIHTFKHKCKNKIFSGPSRSKQEPQDEFTAQQNLCITADGRLAIAKTIDLSYDQG